MIALAGLGSRLPGGLVILPVLLYSKPCSFVVLLRFAVLGPS